MESSTLIKWAIFLVVIIAIIYIITTSTSDEFEISGFWVGNRQFLDTAGIYYLGAQFDQDDDNSGKLSLIIKPLEPSSDDTSITQTYKYTTSGDIITITNELISEGEPILPDGELTIQQKENELAIIDDNTTYLILTKFDEDDT